METEKKYNKKELEIKLTPPNIGYNRCILGQKRRKMAKSQFILEDGKILVTFSMFNIWLRPFGFSTMYRYRQLRIIGLISSGQMTKTGYMIV